MLLEDGFADEFGGHLLFAWKVVGMSEDAVVIDGRIDRQLVLKA